MSAIRHQDRTLLALVLSPISLPELLERSGLPIDQFLDWFDSPPVRRLLDRLQGFATFRTTLKASLAGPAAATALSTLLEATESPVERRRLATTLIRTGKPGRGRRTVDESPPPSPEREPTSRGDPAPQSKPTHNASAIAAYDDVAPATSPQQRRQRPTPHARMQRSPFGGKPTASTMLMSRAGAAELPRAG